MRARIGRAATALLAAVLVCAGCSGDDGSDDDAAPETTTEESGADMGPLALTEGGDGPEASLDGALAITDKCVFLDAPDGQRWLLVWPAERTQWSGEAIVFSSADGEVHQLTTGDQVTLTGGASSESEGGQTFTEWVDGIEWVAPPDESCAASFRWSVGDI